MEAAIAILLLGQFRYAAAVGQPAEAPPPAAARGPADPFPARSIMGLIEPGLFVPKRRDPAAGPKPAAPAPRAAATPARRYRWAADPSDPRVILWGYDDPATGRFLWVSRHWRP